MVYASQVTPVQSQTHQSFSDGSKLQVKCNVYRGYGGSEPTKTVGPNRVPHVGWGAGPAQLVFGRAGR